MKVIAKLFLIIVLNSLIILPCFAQKEIYDQSSGSDLLTQTSSQRISAINPTAETNLMGAFYPGFRGSNQLIIYTPEFGSYTGTNEFGKEAIIIDDRVFGFTGANSYIPSNGYVISGHGTAKKWINQNLTEGAYIKLNTGRNTVESIINIDSYIYQADKRIGEVQKVLMNYKRTLPGYKYKTSNKYYNLALKKVNNAKYYKCSGNHSKALKEINTAITAANTAFYYAVPAIKNELHGIWLRPIEKSPKEIANTLENLKKTGIDNVFLETYYQGYTIFPSSTMASYGLIAQRQEFAGWNPLQVWIEEAHKRNMKIHVWFQTFYVGNENISANPRHILSVYPHWANVQRRNADKNRPMPSVSEHNGYFLDPANNEVQKFLLTLLSEISTNYQIDGLNIDYIRYPKSLTVDMPGYLSSTWGYTDYARKKFKDIHEKDPLVLDEKDPLLAKWIQYRQNTVSEFVSRIKPVVANRNLIVSAVIFPNPQDTSITKLQNWSEWGQNCYVDAFTPLIMSSDDYRAGMAVSEIRALSGEKVMIYPGLFEPFTSGSPMDLLNQIIAVRKAGSSGIVIFDNAHLDDDFITALSARIFRND